jgi:hypothetical protein
MSTIGLRSLHGALILGGLALASGGLYTNYHCHRAQRAIFTWLPRSIHRPAGFGLIVNSDLWVLMTEFRAASWTDGVRDPQVHARIDALIAAAG